MAGSSRITSYGKEKSGYGYFLTTVKTAAGTDTGTSFTLNGGGGANYGAPTVAANMKVFFLDDLTEAAATISAVSGLTTTNGVTTGDAALTTGALTHGTVSTAVGARVLVGYAPDTAFLADAFSSTRNMNKWSSMPYSGTRAKNVTRSRGRIEASGSIEFMLRPTVNAALLAKAIGNDLNVYGTDPTVPVTTTTSGSTAAGATTVTLTSGTGLGAGDYVQLEAAGNAKCEVVKVGSIATNTITIANSGKTLYAHNASAAAKKVIAPFIHKFNSAVNDLDSIAIEDYVPFDDEGQTSGVTTYSYLLTGTKFKSFQVQSQSEQGISVSLDFQSQDKYRIKAQPALAIPSEDTYSFNEEAVLVDGARNYRVTEITISGDNDLQSRYTKNGSTQVFALKAGQQEVTGTLKLYENASTQSAFWDKMDKDTKMALTWTITDTATTYYTKFYLPAVVVDEYNDTDFSPADLVDVEIPFTAILDSATGTQLQLELGNADWLPYGNV